METTPGDADESQVSSILICNIILIVASTLAVFIRIYARIRYISVGWDDYLCIVGWVGINFFSPFRYGFVAHFKH